MGEIQKILFSDGVKATMRKARLFGPGLQREAAIIAKMHGASVTPVNYKSEASIRRKMKADGKGAHELKDTVRTTIIAPAGKIRSVISDLEKLNSKGIKTSRIKDATSEYRVQWDYRQCEKQEIWADRGNTGKHSQDDICQREIFRCGKNTWNKESESYIQRDTYTSWVGAFTL